MSYLEPATPLGLYGPFHCLSASPSPSNTPPPSRSSSHSSASMSSIRSIQSINRILSARRHRYRHRRTSSNTSVQPPTSVTGIVVEDYSDVADQARAASPISRPSSTREVRGAIIDPGLGLMEPRPQEAVGWGIGEVLWGGRH